MDSRSSTSSSSRAGLPWAGLLAAVLVLGGDALLLGDGAPWQSIAERIPASNPTALGVARDRHALAELRAAGGRRPGVALIGSSRAAAGIQLSMLERRLPGVTFAAVAHAGVDPFVICALADELAADGVAAAVLMISELDTHRPLRLEPVPGPGSGANGLRALPDLLAETGAGFAARNRVSLYRLMLTAALRGYRYRRVLAAAGLGTPLAFEFPGHAPAAPLADDAFAAIALGRRASPDLSPEVARRVSAAFRGVPAELRSATAATEVGIVSEIGSGKHVAVQMALLGRAVARFRGVGAAVVLVEAPLHPAAAELYDTRWRRAFTEFAEALAEETGVDFLPLEKTGPFEIRDFSDLLHTSFTGAVKLTRGIVDALRRVLPTATGEAAPRL